MSSRSYIIIDPYNEKDKSSSGLGLGAEFLHSHSFVWGEALFSSWGPLFLDFSMSEVPIKTRFAHPEGSCGCVNRLGSVQGGIPEA